MNLTDYEVSFAYGEGDTPERDEITRNVRTILRTPKGSCPLYRDFGVEHPEIVDLPADVAKNYMAVAVTEAVERFEPRVRVLEVRFPAGEDGSVKAEVVITDAV